MKHTNKQRWWLLVLVGGIVPLALLSGSLLGIPERIIIPIIVVTVLVFSAMLLWMRANANATGDEWWQDESASGWRGY